MSAGLKFCYFVMLHFIYISAAKWLISSKIKVFVYIIYACTVYIMYKYTHIQYIFWKYLHVYIYITYKYLYYGTVECLNLIGWRTFWGVQLFSGKRTANVVPGSSLDRITVPYHFAKWFLLFQRSYNRKIIKTHNDTGQTNKYSKQKDTIDRSCPCFCDKITFYYVRKAHSLLSLSRSRSLPHRHTCNVVSTTLKIWSAT